MKNIDQLFSQIKTDTSGKWISIEEVNKLTELIINNSINVVQQRIMGDNNREDMEVKRCVEALKEYYGL